MTRENIWAIVVLVLLAMLGAYWFSSRFELRAEDERTTPSAEARRNPWLAAQRFVVAMGS